MINVLHIFAAFDNGGIENLIMSIIRYTPCNSVRYHFALSSARSSVFDKEVIKLGYNIHYFDKQASTVKDYKRNLSRIISDIGAVDIVHSHMYFFSGQIFKICHSLGVKTLIAHSHDTNKGETISFKRKLYEIVMRKYLYNYSTFMIGCSKGVCYRVYGNNCFDDDRVEVMYNAIDISLFCYREDFRLSIRKTLGYSDTSIVLGHVGRFTKQKNHKFILQFFKFLIQKSNNYRLLLIGQGEYENDMKEYVKNNIGEGLVTFLGSTKETYKYYNAMDIFFLPSLYEGLPIVLIEAQCNGLPCVVSAQITDEVVVNDNVKKISLTDTFEELSLVINNTKGRQSKISPNLKERFDIEGYHNKLMCLYGCQN